METTPPPRSVRRRPARTPQSDHSEVFIPPRISSRPNRVTTPSKLKNKLQGLYVPEAIHNQAQDLADSISHATNPSDESLSAKLDAIMPTIVSAFAKTIELAMWHDEPKKTTLIKRKKLRKLVAKKLGFPKTCFDNGLWDQKSRIIIAVEVKKQNSRTTAAKREWDKNQSDLFDLLAHETPTKQKRVFEEDAISTPVASAKRSKNISWAGQMLQDYGASLKDLEPKVEQDVEFKEPIPPKLKMLPKPLPAKMVKQRRGTRDPFIKRKPVLTRKK